MDMKTTPKLLVIDDEPEMASFVADIARLLGFDASEISAAAQLLDVSALINHDVIVLDLFMPEVDGLELIEALSEANCTAAIILVSGHDQTFLQVAGEIAKVKGLQLVGTLSKPFQIDELESLLKSAVS